MDTQSLAELRSLTDVSGIGDRRATALYRQFDSVAAMANAPLEQFDDFHYVDANTLAEIRDLDHAIESYRETFDELRQSGTALVGIEDARYPDELREAHAPILLYARGNVSLLGERGVTFSGSRETETRGCEWTRTVASNLADSYVIVSGGATGVDTAAHRGALDADGDTIVVYGTGLNSPYPSENAPLFEEIVESGGLLVSERPVDAGPDRHGFLQRNQTNAALGDAVVIPAAAQSSGTMSQFEDARAQDRPVFVPDQALEFTPTDGIATMRESEGVTSVSEASDVRTELDELAEKRNKNQQASLDDW